MDILTLKKILAISIAETTLKRILKFLRSEGVIRKSKDDSRWVFVDPFLGEWIKNRFPVRPDMAP